jgi:hypothetical protein
MFQSCIGEFFIPGMSVLCVQHQDVEQGDEEEPRARRSQRTPVRRVVRPTAPPPSIQRVRPVSRFPLNLK